jgi:very-short-patch-repair endonuclease
LMGSPNHYHNRICQELSRRGILYMEEYTIGRFSVDIYMPEFKRIIEIDGPTHMKKADRWREDEILALRPELHFVRVKVGVPVPEAMEEILRD